MATDPRAELVALITDRLRRAKTSWWDQLADRYPDYAAYAADYVAQQLLAAGWTPPATEDGDRRFLIAYTMGRGAKHHYTSYVGASPAAAVERFLDESEGTYVKQVWAATEWRGSSYDPPASTDVQRGRDT